MPRLIPSCSRNALWFFVRKTKCFKMSSVHFPSINIREIIERKAVETHFQAIASIRKKSIVGVEALSRGMDSNGDQIPPLTLFRLAAANGLTLELDRLCRATAVESFLQRMQPTRI